jgi:2-polyprenyl-3-methyl-5-hydroxy-6-metoxy-1,4-benzoquinol methylase
MLAQVACNCCGSEDFTIAFGPGSAQRYQIVRCKQCDLMYVNPRPEEPEHAAISRHTESEDTELDALERLQRVEKEQLQVRDYDVTRKLLNSLYPRRGKLLEIGSGFGFLLAAFKADGWDVQGVDPNRQACDFASQQNHIDAHAGTVEAMAYDDETFDVVVMNHVIEHLPDPLAALKEINRIVRHSGHVVIETPRYDTLAYRLLGKRERSLSCEGHIYFFTTDSLRKIYEAAGFRLVDYRPVGRSLTLIRLAYNFGVMSKSRHLQTALDSTSRALQLNKLSIYLNVRDMQRVCVQRQ